MGLEEFKLLVPHTKALAVQMIETHQRKLEINTDARFEQISADMFLARGSCLYRSGDGGWV